MASDGLVDEGWWHDRQADYLRASTQVWNPRSPLNVADHLERRRREPEWSVDLDAVDDESLAVWFDRIDGWKDCADFDILRLLHLWFDDRADLPERIVAPIRQRLAGMKYWYTEPTPEGVVDQRWYWSENHRLIFHAIEHLAGQELPEATFFDGATGAEHHQRATDRLDAWFDEKARYGFSEWHSDVYYEKDLAPLLTLAEHSEDRAVRDRATALLDLLVLDIALHTHAGTIGSTHGRSYMKDKSTGPDQPLFAPAKMLFDDTSLPWPTEAEDEVSLLPRNEGAVLLARARRWRPAEVLRRIATSDATMIDRETMGLVIDSSEPLTEHPVRDDGLSWDDPEMVPFWWDRSALTAWQLVPSTMDTLDRHDLWEADLFAAIRPVRDLTGGDRRVAQELAAGMHVIINAGLLSKVDTVTWRSAHAMLSSAQDYRPGTAGYQHHPWQATLDERAVVFTTHPSNEPWDDTTMFWDPDHYWTGSASLPRTAQHGSAAIHLYAPAFEPPAMPELEAFAYLPMTHAWFPTERFDEVVTDDGWTFGRSGDGYVALWSWRPTRWREHDPAVTFTDGMTEPFDLVAEGGACNAWIVQMGDVDAFGSFADFRSAVLASSVEIDGDPEPVDGTPWDPTLRFSSPLEGDLELSWSGPLLVDGAEVALHDGPRMDNPWCHLEQGQTTVEVCDGDWSLTLDLATGAREASGPS